MFRMKAGEELEKVADEEFKKSLMTDANNKNLAIKKDALSSDYVYIVKLLGYFGEDLKEFGGFAEYRISMNTRPVAPDMSKIKINIKAGEPLKKIFKMSAVGFTDEDLPLSYTMQFQASAKAEWSTFHSSALPITDYFLLPPGDVTFESKVKIRVICRDQLGAATISGSLKVEVSVCYQGKNPSQQLPHQVIPCNVELQLKLNWALLILSAIPITDYCLLPPGDVILKSEVEIRVICRDQLGGASASGSLKGEVSFCY